MYRKSITWRRLGAGHYVSANRKWSVRSWRKREWWVFRDGAPWGRWEQNRGWRRCLPFRTKREAMVALEGYGLPCSRAAAGGSAFRWGRVVAEPFDQFL